MQRIKKLKPDRNITGPLPAIFSLVAGGCVAVVFGPKAGIDTIGVIILVYATFALIAAIKTEAIGYWVTTIYLYCLGTYIIFLEFRPYAAKKFYLTSEAKFLFIWVIFFMLWLIYMMITKRSKWRGRDIMEAAAQTVDVGENSYTARPRPVSRINIDKEQLFAFAKYLKKNLIAMPYYNHEKVIFVPVKMGEEYGILFGPNISYWDRTWISFEYSGDVSVNISKDYYLDYKEDLSFDQLCDSLGNLFIKFYEHFKNQEEVRIIDHLNEMKIGPFS
jgi:hypothetical protein